MKIGADPTAMRQRGNGCHIGGVRRFWRWWSFRKVVIVALALALTLSAITAGARWWVVTRAAGHVYALDEVPETPLALVLGSKTQLDGTPGAFLQARLETARQLFTADRVDTILVSGNGKAEYDEVAAMRQWLVEHDVPETAIHGDRAGYDTQDSCERAARTFDVDAATVITQSFHVERAVALCRAAGIDAIGVGDETTRHHFFSWKRAVTREYLANVKAAAQTLLSRGSARSRGAASKRLSRP